MRRSRTTSIIIGRRMGSWSQQRIAVSHTESVIPNSCAFSGRIGPPLSTISGTTTGVASSLGASPPAKTLGKVQALNDHRRSVAHERTSFTSMPKAKTSVSHVVVSTLSKFSGVALATSHLFPSIEELTSRNTEENSTADKRAWPSRSTKMLGYSRVIGASYDSQKR